MLQIETLTVGGFAMNCYLIWDKESKEAIFIDPGAEADRLIKNVEQQELNVKFIIKS